MNRTRVSKLTLLAALVVGVSGVISAQDLIPKAAPQARDVALVGATLHTVSGDVIEGGTIVFSGGKIVEVSRDGDVSTAADTVNIDARGKHVYPGFVCVATSIGLTEVGAVEMTQDTTEAGRFTPEVRAAVAVNPDSWLIPVTRINGILTCGVWPQGGVIPGRVSVVRMDGWTWEQMAMVQDAGLSLSWPFMAPPPTGDFGGPPPGATGDEALKAVDAFFDLAAAYDRARSADPATPTDLRLAAMSPAVSGEKPVFIQATTRAQIEAAVKWSVARGLKARILGGRDADQCLDLLRRHDVPVAITAAHRLPHRRDLSFREPYELPGKLEDAGIRWCLTYPAAPWSTSNARNLPYEAAACVVHGLSRAAAIRSITLGAAQFLGVDDRVGALEVGKAATLIVTDGDPFELTTRVELAFIDGRRIVLRDKQTELEKKYREKYRQMGLIK